MPAPRLGCFLLRPGSVAEALDRFELAEELGYDAAFATHVNSHEATTLMAAAAVRTQRIAIGVGVIPIYTRSPATMAQTAATMWELSGGRTMLGVGLGHKMVMESWHGETIDRPAAEMREYVTTMRAIVDGEVPPADGVKYRSDMPLILLGPFPQMPILIGALSPAMLRLAGEIADGVVLWLATPRYVAEHVVPHVREGREKAGRTMDGFDVVASIPCAVTDDAPALRADLVKQVAHNLRLPYYRAMLERGGHLEDLALIDAVGSYAELGAPLDASVLERLAGGSVVRDLGAIGSAADVAAKLAEYGDAGVTIAGVNPVRIKDFDATLRAVRGAVA